MSAAFRRSWRRHLNQAYATTGIGDVARALFAVYPSSLASWFRERFAGDAFAYGSGRAALCALLRAAGIGPGDEVILCGFTCLAVPEAVIYAGATPVYADLAPGAWSSGPSDIEACAGPRTRGIVVQHSFGLPAPIEELAELARRRGWTLIEDCALALGSSRGDRALGSFGDAAIFSFEMTKTVTGGWGGMTVVREAKLAAAMSASYAREAQLAPHKTWREALQVLLSALMFRPALFGIAKYAVAALYRSGAFRMSGRPLHASPPRGWSYRLPRFSAALVDRQLRRLDEILRARRAIADAYQDGLARAGLADSVGPRPAGVELLRYPILVEDAQRLVDEARSQGIELGRWFDAPVAPMPDPPARVNYRWGQCPRAESVARHVVNLPLDPRMTAEDIVHVLELVRGHRLLTMPDRAAAQKEV